LLENIRVRRAGFAYRQIFEKFLERFFLLSRRTSYAGEYIWTGDSMTGCRCICEDCGIAREEWQIGTTKVFIRHPETLWALEHLRERYWHNMAMRIQRAYKNYVRYKNECAIRIQRCFRSWNNTKVYLQIREYGHQVLGGRKERRRYSLLSMRRFMGDYLEFRLNTVLQNACGSSAYHEGVVFTSKCQILVQRMLKSPKPSPRFLVMTRQAIYIIVTRKEKNLAVTELERRINLASIQGFGMSPYMDEAIILYIPSEYDAVLFCIFKTELATHLAWLARGNIAVEISPALEFNKKPGKKSKITFAKDEMVQKEFIMKKGVVLIGSGRPPSSVSDPPCRRNEPPPRPVTTGKLLRKGGPGQPPGGAPKAVAIKPVGTASKPSGGNPAPVIPKQPAAAPAPVIPKQAAPAPVIPKQPAAAPAPVIPKQAAPPPQQQQSKHPRFKAIFPYEAQDEGEISFPVGAILEISEMDENGWWCAKFEDKEGWIPSNYLEPIVEQPTPTPKPVPPKPASAPTPVPASAPKPVVPAPNNPAPAPKPVVPAARSAVVPQPKPVASPPSQDTNEYEESSVPTPKLKPFGGAAPGGFAPPVGLGQGALKPTPKPSPAIQSTPNNPTPSPVPKPNVGAAPAPISKPTPASAPMPTPAPKPAPAPAPIPASNPTPAPKPNIGAPASSAPTSTPAPAPKPNVNVAPKPAVIPPKPAPPTSKPAVATSTPLPASAPQKPAWAKPARPPSPDAKDDDWD